MSDNLELKCANCLGMLENGDMIVYNTSQEELVLHTNWHMVDGDPMDEDHLSCYDRYGLYIGRHLNSVKGMFWDGKLVNLPDSRMLDNIRGAYRRTTIGYGARYQALSDEIAQGLSDAINDGKWPIVHVF